MRGIPYAKLFYACLACGLAICVLIGRPAGARNAGTAGPKAEAPFHDEGVTVEQVASWIEHPGFRDWIVRYPDLAEAIARFPYTGNLFYEKPFFRPWSEKFPFQAMTVMEAAMEWRSYSQARKADFFRRYPNLASDPKGFEGYDRILENPLPPQQEDQAPETQKSDAPIRRG